MTTKNLSEAEIGDLLGQNAGTVMVKVSADWCVPCKLAAPVMRKLALEFADRMTLVELDGDAAPAFRKMHEVRSIPEVLVFVAGKLAGRVSGYSGPEKLRAEVAGQLGADVAGEASAAELSFRDACAGAAAAFDRATGPLLAVVRAHYAEIEPAIEAMEESIAADVAAGRLSKAEARDRMDAEHARLEAPFQDKLDALDEVKSDALGAYEAIMGEAVAAFARGAAPARPSRSTDIVGMACKPGDRSCSIGRAAAL